MSNKYKIFDSHAHYDDEQFDDDRDSVLKELFDTSVIGIINCSSSYDSIKTTCDLAKKWEKIYIAVGIHPENADEYTDQRLTEIEKIIQNNKKVVAVGEIGLDYHFDDNPPKDVQKHVLRQHMKLADKYNLPVIIHDRDAHLDTLEILKEFPNVKGVLHCFSGSVEFSKEILKLGYYLGVNGVATFKNSKKTAQVIKATPIDKILVETDCPYLSPEPNRGKRNKSDNIEYVIDKIAEIKNMDGVEISCKVNDNLSRLMNIGK